MSKHYNIANRREEVYNKYDGRCAYCGCAISFDNFSVDHISAKFRGHSAEKVESWGREKGCDSMENYNPSCKSCNSSKSTFTVEKWRDEISKKFDRLKRDDSQYRLLLRFGRIVENKEPILFFFETYENGRKLG